MFVFKSWGALSLVYLTVLGLSGSTWDLGCIIQGLLCGATGSLVAGSGLSSCSTGTPEHVGSSSSDTWAGQWWCTGSASLQYVGS